jgi:Holliday junction resolvase RusA-like endonuclease
MNIELKIKPLSVNEAFQGRRFKTNKYKKYESDLLLILPNRKNPMPDMIAIDLHFGFKNSLSDLDNPVKPLLDILQKKYGFDDKDIWELNIRKTTSKQPFILITIRELLPFK